MLANSSDYAVMTALLEEFSLWMSGLSDTINDSQETLLSIEYHNLFTP